MNELKPCPFCKTFAGFSDMPPYEDHTGYVRCNFCGAKTPFDTWNNRPIEDALNARIAELEAAQRWIPVSEPPKECEMRVFKDGDAWCFVLPDFQDLQVSPSVWMKKGVLDKIYKELRSVR